MKNHQTESIRTRSETILDQVADIIDRLHPVIRDMNFQSDFSDANMDKLKLHLGYTKNYSDLAKTRLIYPRVIEMGEYVNRPAAPRTHFPSPANKRIKKGA